MRNYIHHQNKRLTGCSLHSFNRPRLSEKRLEKTFSLNLFVTPLMAQPMRKQPVRNETSLSTYFRRTCAGPVTDRGGVERVVRKDETVYRDQATPLPGARDASTRAALALATSRIGRQ